jgi:hypothetical protein
VSVAGVGVTAAAGSGVGGGGVVCAVVDSDRPASGVVAVVSPPELDCVGRGVVGSGVDEHALAVRLSRIARTAVVEGVERIVPLIIR